jgi:hypothetical protein
MTTKKFVQGLIVTVALCLSATAGRAQGNEIFLMGGASLLSDKRYFSEFSIPYRSTYAIGGKVIVGVDVPLKKSKIFGLEASYGFGDKNLELANGNWTYLPVTAYSMRNNRVSVDLVARTPTAYRGARPYVVFGLEYDRFSPTGSAASVAAKEGFAYEPTATLASQSIGGANLGGGIDLKLTSKVDLRIDVRDHITSSPTLGLPTSEPATAGLPWFPVSGIAYTLEYSIGIVYKFRK